MKTAIKVMTVVICTILSTNTYAWGRKNNSQAAIESKAAAKAEKQKNGIKNWQMTRFKNAEVRSAISANGKLTSSDVAVTCKLPEAQTLMDSIIAGYVSLVNILDGYVEVEEGNAIAGLVATRMNGGKSKSEALEGLSDSEKEAFENYVNWIKEGENEGRLIISDEDLEKIMAASNFTQHLASIKQSVSGKMGAKFALARDGITFAKVAGSVTKGGLMLKGILDREKMVKKLIAEKGL